MSHNPRSFFNSILHRSRALFLIGGLFTALLLSPQTVYAAAFLLSPTSGTFTVGSTFDVQILLDTDDESINALDVSLRFPPDKLQLVSPKTSLSIISVWTSQPKFNNQNGSVRLQGGIPGGVNVNSALVATLTFRVKSVGNAIVSFGDESKALLNDGLGTNDLRRREGAVYSLVLPPPAGPIVVSETHSNQAVWYSNSNAVLRWSSNDPVENYSYILDKNPVSLPDDIPEGNQNSVAYKNLSDGQHYFHIKALRNSSWGGVTHFVLNIDTEPPALFPIEVLPTPRTTVRSPVVKFATTDTLSGIDHFELRTVVLSPTKSEDGSDTSADQNFFVEAQSPYIAPPLEVGPYDAIVRAIDKAGNIQEVTQRFYITSGFLSWSTNEGVIIGSIIVGWPWIFLFLLLLIMALFYIGYELKRRHDNVVTQRVSRELPSHVKSQLEELKKYKSKYGAVAILLVLLSTFSLVFSNTSVYAQNNGGETGIVELAPPFVTTISRDVSNNEIFYIGGKTENKDTTVIIYGQNVTTGETTSYEVVSDKKGEWFYRHNGFLTPGEYVLWMQAKIGDIVSPPSPQIEMSVARAAITFGVTRISFETLFGFITGLLLVLIFVLIGYIIYHAYHGRLKHKLLMHEIREAEESVRRGFAVLRRDIERELEAHKKRQSEQQPTEEEKARERELVNDLKDIERRIGKEVWDIEKVS
jgi:hypothetical protein